MLVSVGDLVWSLKINGYGTIFGSVSANASGWEPSRGYAYVSVSALIASIEKAHADWDLDAMDSRDERDIADVVFAYSGEYALGVCGEYTGKVSMVNLCGELVIDFKRNGWI